MNYIDDDDDTKTLKIICDAKPYDNVLMVKNNATIMCKQNG